MKKKEFDKLKKDLADRKPVFILHGDSCVGRKVLGTLKTGVIFHSPHVGRDIRGYGSCFIV